MKKDWRYYFELLLLFVLVVDAMRGDWEHMSAVGVILALFKLNRIERHLNA